VIGARRPVCDCSRTPAVKFAPVTGVSGLRLRGKRSFGDVVPGAGLVDPHPHLAPGVSLSAWRRTKKLATMKPITTSTMITPMTAAISYCGVEADFAAMTTPVPYATISVRL